MFEITEFWFNYHRDYSTGLNRKQAEAVGEKYPLKRGWRERVLGRTITYEQKRAFEEAKGAVKQVVKKQVQYNRKKQGLMAKVESVSVELELAKLEAEIRKLKRS